MVFSFSGSALSAGFFSGAEAVFSAFGVSDGFSTSAARTLEPEKVRANPTTPNVRIKADRFNLDREWDNSLRILPSTAMKKVLMVMGRSARHCTSNGGLPPRDHP